MKIYELIKIFDVAIAAYNTPNQIIVSGKKENIEKLVEFINK